jgi:hypothetical protein
MLLELLTKSGWRPFQTFLKVNLNFCSPHPYFELLLSCQTQNRAIPCIYNRK